MNRERTVKQGTTHGTLTGTLTHDRGRQLVLLTEAVGVTGLTLRARGIGTGTTFSGPAEILDDGTDVRRGQWSYSWGDGDTEVVDLYDLEFVIHYSDGEEVVPSSGYGQLRVEPALV